MAVALQLQPLAPVGVTFEWVDEQLVAKAFVEGDGVRARSAGVREGMALVSINGHSLDGWTFAQLVAAIKSAAGGNRTLVFAPSKRQLALAPKVPPTPAPQRSGMNNRPAATTSSVAASARITRGAVVSASHSDPFSTPSRRRRVFLQVRKATRC
jgi:hypothetical protein